VTTYRTKTGRILSDADIEAIAAEVESDDFDIEDLKTRLRPGGPHTLAKHSD